MSITKFERADEGVRVERGQRAGAWNDARAACGVWETERRRLQPLGNRPPYPYADEPRRVARDAYVSWQGSRYSVPRQYVGKEVWVPCGLARATAERINAPGLGGFAASMAVRQVLPTAEWHVPDQPTSRCHPRQSRLGNWATSCG